MSFLLAQLYKAILHGWRRNILLFWLGALSVCAFSPFNLWLILLITLPVFFTITDAALRLRRATLDGFWFGYGFFMVGTYWIAISMTVQMDKFAWMIPFSVLGLSALLALSFALMTCVYYRLKTSSLTANLLLFSALWVSVEYLRSLSALGFAWNLIGYSLVSIPALLQIASLLGIYGMSLLTVMVALAIVPLMRANRRRADTHFSVLALVLLVAAYGYGVAYQMHDVEVKDIVEKPMRLRIVQANIPQSMKWDALEVNGIMRVHKSLSKLESDAPPPDIVIWSESAIPTLLTSNSDWTQYLHEMIPANALLISGVVREGEDRSLYNSVALFDNAGKLQAHYDKRHLVPFGEYMPLRDILPLDSLAASSRDFSRGNRHDALAVDGIPVFMPIICYESIFPWLAKASDETQAQWIMMITNDAWFGNSIGPYQHFSFAQVRAVEQGLPLVRAANTGISGLINMHGMVVKRLGIGVRGVIDVTLPQESVSTVYRVYGDLGIGLVLLTIYLLVWRYSYTT